MIIVAPADLPDDDLRLFVNKSRLSFVAGTRVLADVPYKDQPGDRIFNALSASEKVGIVEAIPGQEFPKAITAVATVQLGSPASLRLPDRLLKE
ncbi:MAG: hypothetical protein ABMA15_13035 [Vicinamibacterales bacterium]